MLKLTAIALILGVILAPVYVSHSRWKDEILPSLLPSYPGKIATGQASLYWWSPVKLEDVRFDDLEGEPLLTVETVTSEKTLIALCLDRVRLGGFYLDQPKLEVRLKQDGSNLEEAIAPLLEPGQGEGVDSAYHIRGGVVQIWDSDRERSTRLGNVRADISLPNASGEAVQVRGEASVRETNAGHPIGGIDFDAAFREGEDDAGETVHTGMLRLKTADLKLEPLSAALSRWLPQIELSGILVSDVKAEWTVGGANSGVRYVGNLNATNLGFAETDLLGPDRIHLDYFTQEGRVDYRAGNLHLAGWKVSSDLLSGDADGDLDFARFLEGWKQSTTEIPSENLQLKGQLNLARLAGMLPSVFHLRQGLALNSGTLFVELDAKTKASGQEVSGSIRTDKIAGVIDGQEISWDKPIDVRLKARNTPAGPIVDEFVCRSGFLSLWSQGSRENFTFKLACQLDQLMAEVNRFADLEAWQIAGRIDAAATIKRINDEQTRAAASAVVKDFRFNRPGGDPNSTWTERTLTITAGGEAVRRPGGEQRLENVSLKIASGTDELKLTQTKSVAWTDSHPNLGFIAELHGDLSTWQNRMRPFVDIDSWKAGGTIVATAQAQITNDRLTFDKVLADFRDVDVTASGVRFNEPKAHVETEGEWHFATTDVRLPVTTWASPSLSLRIDDFVSAVEPNQDRQTSGRAVFRGRLADICRWLTKNELPARNHRLDGTASGQLDLQTAGTSTNVRWSLLAENVLLSKITRIEPPPGVAFRRVNSGPELIQETLWSDDRIAFQGDGVYRTSEDRLDLKSSRIESSWLSLAGSVSEFTSKGEMNLAGTLTCNLSSVADRFRKRLPESFRIKGNETRPFTLRGSLWGGKDDAPLDVSAFAIVPWQSLDVYGVSAGPAELPVEWNQGLLQLGPLDVAIEEGRLRWDSYVDWRTERPALVVKKGPLLENVRLTQQVSRGWIQYPLPILGDSTDVDGRFSAFLTENGAIPLDAPEWMTGQAIVRIESARMRPGRLANALLDATQQIKSLLRGQRAGRVLPEGQSLVRLEKQDVKVQFANGRVYHQNLKLILAGVPITTTGSVGFDETLSIMAEIPIQPEWMRDNRWLGGVRGQAMRIPIGGTLSRPLVDARAIAIALEQSLQNAAGQIGNGLRNQFDRLFNRP